MESLQTLLSPQQYRNFNASIRAEATRKTYTFFFQKYTEFVDGKIFKDPRQLEIQIIDYLLSLRGVTYATVKTNLDSIIHFYTMNDVLLNRRKISKFIHSTSQKRKNNIGYSREQIVQLLSVCDKRTRAVVLLFASSGMRLAGLADLKIGDLKTIELDENFYTYQITVYEGEKEEYITFCTPECYNAIRVYLEYRERTGEKLKPSSPVIRDAFSPKRPLSVNAPKKMGLRWIESLLERKAIDAGLRAKEKNENCDSRNSTSRYRKSIQIAHGFRKFFNTAMINSDVNHIFKELLMGHTVKLDDVYYDTDSEKSRQKLLDEYCKGLEALTISEENQLKRKVAELTIRQDEFMEMKKNIDELCELVKRP
jgi:integrase